MSTPIVESSLNHKVFVVRVWQRPNAAGQATWVGRVEQVNPLTGAQQPVPVAGVEALLAYLRTQMPTLTFPL